MRSLLYMAPVRGVTNHIYRNVYSKLFDGYDRCVTPFVKSSKGRKSTLKDVLPENNNTSFEVIPQILSNNAKEFLSLANGIFDLGYKTVNWNLGCPLPMVRKKKRGSGLLPFPDEVVSFLEEVMPKLGGKISIKVRLGSEDANELAKLLPRLDAIPLEEVIIHPRTGEEMYKGEPDLISFSEAASLTAHTVVYNGDIDSVHKFNQLAERFSDISRWMIGRGGIVDPFLPERIKGKIYGYDMGRFRELHDAILDSYKTELSGASHLIGKMKESWRYWASAFEEGDRFFMDISRVKSINKYLYLVDRFFDSDPALRASISCK